MPYSKVYEDTLYSPKWLQRVYVEEGKNAEQVAKLIGCTRQAVHHRLRRYGIERKSISEAQVSGSTFEHTLHNVEWLQQQLKLGLSLAEIGRRAGGMTPAGVYHLLDKKGLLDQWRKVRRSTTADKRANRKQGKLLPPGPCLYCESEERVQVNHIDRKAQNDDPSNLERLCAKCHLRQHAYELRIAYELLAERGISATQIHDLARDRLKAKGWVSRQSLRYIKRCPALSRTGLRCVLPAGHEGKHSTRGG